MLYLFDLSRIINGCVDFQAVADDACIGKQPLNIGFVKCGDRIDVETFKCRLKCMLLLQHQRPAQSCLIDFQHQPLKQFIVVLNRKTVLRVVIMFVGVVRIVGKRGDKFAVIHVC